MKRYTKKSVTCFLHHQNDFLFVNRIKKEKDVDAGKLNGIGGKLELGEDFLHAAIRETQEETGFEVSALDCTLKAVVNMTGGYKDDWVMCFFSITVPHKNIPIGTENPEGELIWLPKEKVLDSEYELVDDLYYCWDHLSNHSKRILFAGALVNEQEKIEQWKTHFLE